ncbi:MAG: Rne/Rng family ribonuclease [Candidatus Marinimicrobia bacterium]|nr:Rne/Rng family ribonuclease [Candidatus Neomarinimicrobiota bacterium]
MLFNKKISKEIVINVESLETRVAVLDQGRLEGFFVERNSEERMVGSIFKGRIQNLEDGLQAAFVDIGARKNAFIHYWDMIPEDAARLEAEEGVKTKTNRKKRYEPGEMAKQFPQGSEIIVQVTKDAIGTKGPRVTANLSIPGRYLVMMPGSELKGVSKKIDDAKERERLKKILVRLPALPGMGLIVRTAGAGARKTSFVRDVQALVATWKEIEEGTKNTPAPCRLYQEPDLIERIVRDALTEEIDRIVVDSREEYERLKVIVSRFSRRGKHRLKLYDGEAPVFEHCQVDQQLENAFRRKVWLKSGGYIVFDETEALVAIDVNTGRHKGAATQEEAILEVNLEAADEVARQMRLRNIGGLVVIDFIDMRHRRNQNQVYKALKEALASDRARTNVLPVSSLGLVEMTRQRVEESIRAANYMDCPYCRGRGKVLSDLSMSVEVQRRLIEVLKRHRKEPGLPVRVIVNPEILARLQREDEDLLVEIEKKYDAHLAFAVDPQLHIEQFVIQHAQSGDVLYRHEEN